MEISIKSYKCNYEIEQETWEDDISAGTPFKRTELVYRYSIKRDWDKMMNRLSKKSTKPYFLL
jgi:hypothetical protein